MSADFVVLNRNIFTRRLPAVHCRRFPQSSRHRPELAVLRTVVDEGPLTASYLASVQHVSPQSIAQNLAVLKAAGLVRGHRDPGDGRKTLISADPSAARLLTSITDSRESFLTRAIDKLPASEREGVERTIELLERFAAVDVGKGGTR
ncbi:MAG TPA: MarR family transcriptional regulator [Streptosporangiaceae bacterium]